MTTITLQGTITDSSGATASWGPVTASTDTITITGVTVTPAVAPPGTSRQINVMATNAGGLPMTGTINAVPGVTFTPVTPPPAGVAAAWTFPL